jgi:hypothetical protein
MEADARDADFDRRAYTRLCFHEAGHAVAFRLAGVAITRLWADRALERGRCETANEATITAPAKLVSILAGEVAARLISCGPDQEAHDRRDAALVAELIDAANPQGATARGWQQAIALVQEHRGEIERLAAALGQAGELSGQEIDAVLGPAESPKTQRRQEAVEREPRYTRDGVPVQSTAMSVASARTRRRALRTRGSRSRCRTGATHSCAGCVGARAT